MTLHLHRAASTELLADGLAELLLSPLADPFEQEVVLVPARGVERWLGQRLSHRLGAGPRGDGVCAGVRFLNPHALIALLLGRERDDLWQPDRLVWPLLEVIDASLEEPWCRPLGRHLGHGRPPAEAELARNRRWSVAHRLASLFAAYAVQRPQLIADWRAGRDTDGAGGPIDPDLAWQPELWRRLLAVVGEQPDVRHALAVERLRAGEEVVDLPARLSLFGHTRIPVTEVELLAALAVRHDVHLWLPQTSPALFDRLAPVLADGPVPRAEDRSAASVRHPLLASLGRDARELARALAPVVDAESVLESPPTERAPTLLHWLQEDLREDRAPGAELRATRRPEPGDRSVQVHACHGLSRQVEVLREVLVGLLQDDPTLEPRDILVLCPDIESAAPLLQAGFGLGGSVGDAAHPAHRLRVRLADRALSHTNPLLGLAMTLVDLAGGRVTASEVLDLLGRDVVRRRFRFDDDELERLADWVGRAGVRWGLDASRRAAFEMGRFPDNTWERGLDRLLLGVAMFEDDHPRVAHAVPVDDVGSADIDLAGRLAEAIDRLTHCLDALSAATTVTQWMAALADGVRALGEVPADDGWQLSQFERELARATDDAAEIGGDAPIRLADVRALLASRLAGRPTRANFRTGTLTVCTMVPMRSVPHRVVCLLGLDDGTFPRQVHLDGDDVLARRPITGERDRRSEDRQLLLDAVMSAGETLVVTYTGADEHTGAACPPAVPLGELLDAVDRTSAHPVREWVVTRHPLQPHDPRNLRPGALLARDDVSFSFDRAALAGAVAGAAERHPAPPFLAGPLPAEPGHDVNLADLVAFFGHPVRSFARGRLQLGVPLEAEEAHDAIPIDLDSLEQWGIGDRLLREVLAGHDPVAVLTTEQLTGALPPSELGASALRAIATDAQALFARTAPLREGTRRSLDVTVPLAGGRLLTGTVPDVFGSRLVSLGFSRLGPRQRLTSWIRLLALSAAHPDESFTAHAVGRGRAGPSRALLEPVDHRATDWLRDLVAVYDAGQCQPLPLPLRTACAWAEARAQALLGQDVDPDQRASREWTTDRNNTAGIPGEDADPWHARVWGPGAPVDAVLDAGLGAWAWRVWGPLLSGPERVAPL